MANQGEQGTGKHAHKSTQEPYPHTKDSHGSERQSGSRHTGAQGGGEARQSSGEQGDDLKSREYKDEQGNVHHHTRTYKEQHKGE